MIRITLDTDKRFGKSANNTIGLRDWEKQSLTVDSYVHQIHKSHPHPMTLKEFQRKITAIKGSKPGEQSVGKALRKYREFDKTIQKWK